MIPIEEPARDRLSEEEMRAKRGGKDMRRVQFAIVDGKEWHRDGDGWVAYDPYPAEDEQ